MKICKVEKCERKTDAKGLCHTHYEYQRRNGTTEKIIRDYDKDKLCTVNKCHRNILAKKLCHTHYEYFRRNGTTDLIIKLCKEEECDKRVVKQEYCRFHLSRLRRTGETRGRNLPREYIVEGDTILIPLNNERSVYTKVSVEDKWVTNHVWSLNSSKGGYAINRNLKKLHHNIVGKPPKGLVTDHINRDRLDNRRENLRFITNAENIRNSDRFDK